MCHPRTKEGVQFELVSLPLPVSHLPEPVYGVAQL